MTTRHPGEIWYIVLYQTLVNKLEEQVAVLHRQIQFIYQCESDLRKRKVSALRLLLEMVCAYNFSQSLQHILPSAAILDSTPLCSSSFWYGPYFFILRTCYIAICCFSLQAGWAALQSQIRLIFLRFECCFWRKGDTAFDQWLCAFKAAFFRRHSFILLTHPPFRSSNLDCWYRFLLFSRSSD